ncbi:MAG: NAD(P)/FAD-dependent oxidoreductase, partial [Actinomycetota bacterium]|nr:NAD(P)/FAD-dependent oxidoreductase [Actinomycetota bacterium]
MSSPDGFDAVVVGAGPNGLVAALSLARRGRRVLIVEAADRVGGALRSEELTLPGFVHDVGATVLPLALASAAFREIDPVAHGVEWAHPPVPVAHPLGGAAVFVYRDLDRTADALGRDARAWRALVGGAAAGGERLVDALLAPLSPRRALRAAPALLRYGVTGILPAAVVARTVLRTPEGQAVFAGLAGHSVLSLRQPATAGYGTFMAALAHEVGWPVVRGGSEKLAIALASALRQLGGEIHTGSRIRDLAELPPARSVLLDLTPRQVIAV